MRDIELGYGQTSIKFSFDPDQFEVLAIDPNSERPLSDAEVGEAFDSPISSPPLDELLSPDDSVLIVVSDATRATGSAQSVNLLVRRLIQIGVSPSRLAIIFATGIHRRVTPEEKMELLTSFIVQRVTILDHDSNDQTQLVSLGTTRRGIEVQVNRALQEFSRIILTGGINFHYFAGFTGGRKSICPGLAGAETIEATHMLALDFESGGRKAGVGTGLLDGNAVHEECDRIAELINPAFSINAIVDERKRTVRLFCGDWRMAHRVACDHYLDSHSLTIGAKRGLVIASCGGSPYDINLIQAHKALDMATHACDEGGSIILLAACKDGLGRSDFMKWFTERDPQSLAERLRDEYEVNGQTAWSLLTKAERFKIYLVSDLPAEDVERMRMIPVRTLADALDATGNSGMGFIMARGAAVLPRAANNSNVWK